MKKETKVVIRVWAVCANGLPLIYFAQHQDALDHKAKCMREQVDTMLVATLTIVAINVWGMPT